MDTTLGEIVHLPRGNKQDSVLREHIERIHQRGRRTYGAPRAHAELRALGVRCGKKRVARLMREPGTRGCLRGRKRRTTTYRDRHAVPAPDLVNRNFASGAVNGIRVADIAYLKTAEGFLHLAFIPDACSRRVVGRSMASHLGAELVVEAPEMAIRRRKPALGLIHHSDRGSRYTSLSFGKHLEEAGVLPSMGRADSAGDNAMAESFVSTSKAE